MTASEASAERMSATNKIEGRIRVDEAANGMIAGARGMAKPDMGAPPKGAASEATKSPRGGAGAMTTNTSRESAIAADGPARAKAPSARKAMKTSAAGRAARGSAAANTATT